MTLRAQLMLTAAVSSAVFTGSALAQDTSTIRSRSNLVVASSANMEHIAHKTALSAGDIRFLRQMSVVHRTEIKFGQLAQNRGGDWAKGYGKDMEREHNLALAELQKIAKDNGIALPTDLSPTDARMLRRMDSMSGSAFDNHYRQMMIAGHNQVLGIIQNEIRGGHGEAARDYAVMMETAVKLHLRLAREQTTMMGGASG